MIRKPDSSSSYNSSIIVPVVIAIIGLITFMIFRFSKSPCQRFASEVMAYYKDSFPLKNSFLVSNIDQQYYVDTTGVIKFCCLDKNEIHNRDFHFNLRKEAFKKGLNSITDSFVIKYDSELLESYFKESLSSKELTLEEGTYHNLILVRELQPIITPNNLSDKRDSCSISFSVHFATPKYAELLIPDEIRAILNDAIDECEEFKKLSENPINTSIDFSKVQACLESNQKINDNLDEYVQKYKKYLQLVDIGMPWLLNKEERIHFQKGQYEIPGLSGLIAEKVCKRYEKAINKDPDADWEIICFGYADASPIRGNIRYSGNAYYSPTFPTGYSRNQIYPSNKQIVFLVI